MASPPYLGGAYLRLGSVVVHTTSSEGPLALHKKQQRPKALTERRTATAASTAAPAERRRWIRRGVAAIDWMKE